MIRGEICYFAGEEASSGAVAVAEAEGETGLEPCVIKLVMLQVIQAISIFEIDVLLVLL